MIIFIDESGDAGFKIKKGSTSTFVIALVIFEDELDAEETALKIKQYRRSIGKKDKFEFKFNKLNKNNRVEFLKTIRSCKFKVRAIIFQKEKIYSHHLRSQKEGFYSYAVKIVLKHNFETIQDARLRIDGLGERRFRKSFTSYLRRELNKGGKSILKNLKFRDSKKDVLIQLADMIAGSIRRSYDAKKKDKYEYRKIISSKLEDIWEFQ